MTFLVFISALQTRAQDDSENITLEDIWVNYKFFPRSVRGMNSLHNGEQYTMIKNGSLVVYDYKTGDSITTMIQSGELLVDGEDEPVRLSSFSMNKDTTGKFS